MSPRWAAQGGGRNAPGCAARRSRTAPRSAPRPPPRAPPPGDSGAAACGALLFRGFPRSEGRTDSMPWFEATDDQDTDLLHEARRRSTRIEALWTTARAVIKASRMLRPRSTGRTSDDVPTTRGTRSEPDSSESGRDPPQRPYRRPGATHRLFWNSRSSTSEVPDRGSEPNDASGEGRRPGEATTGGGDGADAHPQKPPTHEPPSPSGRHRGAAVGPIPSAPFAKQFFCRRVFREG